MIELAKDMRKKQENDKKKKLKPQEHRWNSMNKNDLKPL